MSHGDRPDASQAGPRVTGRGRRRPRRAVRPATGADEVDTSAGFGGSSTDDTDAGWGEADVDRDAWFRAQRPPHWE